MAWMGQSRESILVYLEKGRQRTFAGVLDWPGWCRGAVDEDAALQAIVDYGPRYAAVLGTTRIAFQAPSDTSAFTIIDRLPGDATTDFGAPGQVPAWDLQPLDDSDLTRQQELLSACWQAFDASTLAAAGKALRKGPRGGGRDLEAIGQHVLEADSAYLARLGRKFRPAAGLALDEQILQTRQAMQEALGAAVRGELPSQGPRGGVRWPARYFVRRVAWHVLDHAWEIEDRIED
jgi:hypothetical protein